MRIKRWLALLLVLCITFVCVSCGAQGGDGGKENVEPDTPSEETTPPDAETAMDNFVKKLEAGNYVIAPEQALKIVAYSPEQVYFTEEEDSWLNHAFMTLDGETFSGDLTTDGVEDVVFTAKGTAIEALGTTLPNSWIELSDGNMWNLFYNNVDNPLEFTTNDTDVKLTLMDIAGYSQFALDLMEEVHVVLDAEDPTTVRFTAAMQEGGYMFNFPDLDLTMKFGTATSDSRIEKWLANPVYPPTRSGWDDMDVATLDMVFMKDYGIQSVPFPSFASYALLFDENAYMDNSEILLTDAHGTEEDVKNYEKTLVEMGYELAEDSPEGPVYRKLLREDYHAYAQLIPTYDNGFTLHGQMYYDSPRYEGQEEINKVLTDNGFVATEPTDIFTGWAAINEAFARSESWLYYFDYNLYMPFQLEYEDEDAARAYLEQYGESLVAQGFRNAYVPCLDAQSYKNANERITFQYTFNGDGTVAMEFKNEKSVEPAKANKIIAEHGIPDPQLFGDIASRDLTRYYYNVGEFQGLYFVVYQTFASEEEAEQFLDAYTATLDEQGFLMANPQNVGSQRQFVYLNEELRKYVGFDYYLNESGATAYFEFVSIESQGEELPQGILERG